MARATWIVLSMLVFAPIAKADWQSSARMAVGGGARLGPEQSGGIFDLALRSEVLFGAPRPGVVRVGPAIDLRTATFRTFEPAAGAMLLIPTWEGYPILLTAAAGYALRRGDRPDAPFALGTLAWAYRRYNPFSPYGFGFQAYVTTRADLDGSGRWEITGGIELDLVFLLSIPFGALRALLGGGEPTE